VLVAFGIVLSILLLLQHELLFAVVVFALIPVVTGVVLFAPTKVKSSLKVPGAKLKNEAQSAEMTKPKSSKPRPKAQLEQAKVRGVLEAPVAETPESTDQA
jgi:hypothetical protein